MPRTLAPLTVALVLAAAAPAAAQEPPPAPPAAQLKLNLVRVAKNPTTALAGERFVVRGRLTPYVAGQSVKVRLFRKGRKLAAKTLRVRKDGRFEAGMASGRPGRLSVRAEHVATPELGAARARVKLYAVRPLAAPGSHGPAVKLLQRELHRRGYAIERSGRFGASTSRAILAFRKLTKRTRVAAADRTVFRDVVAGKGHFKVRYPKHRKHVEGDLTHQVMALIGKRGRVRRIYNISSGTAVTPTILGKFRVYRKDYGTNGVGMVHSAYFKGGYAIHGYHSVPTYPASHGCLRVPVPQALDIFNWIDMGTRVDVYYRR
jgi:hypothetical protein